MNDQIWESVPESGDGHLQLEPLEELEYADQELAYPNFQSQEIKCQAEHQIEPLLGSQEASSDEDLPSLEEMCEKGQPMSSVNASLVKSLQNESRGFFSDLGNSRELNTEKLSANESSLQQAVNFSE